MRLVRIGAVAVVALFALSAQSPAPESPAPQAPAPQAPAPAAPAPKNARPVMDFAFGALRQFPPNPPWWNNLVSIPPADEGVAGAELGIEDNNSAGQFLKQNYKLVAKEVVPFEADPMPAFQRILDAGAKFIVLDVPADTLLKIADAAKGKDVILFNAGATDDRLRQQDCRPNLLHTAPNRAMLADALAQYLVSKRWANWFLIVGRRPEDRLYADAIKRAARKFGGKIIEEKTWNFGPDVRETGADVIPVFTQGASKADVIVVADELKEFGDLIGWRSWDPKLVVGTAGLTPATWHVTVDSWGAAQVQNRFFRLAKRGMRPLDFQFWLAMRTIGETTARVRSTDSKTILDYVFGPRFELAGFKGQSFSYRPWDHQLRQPIVLAQPTALVATSPQEGFLHQNNPLDSLGFDKPESQCKFPAAQ
ncbi:ABC transporter substrate-binding protein [Methylopila sp. M107]|uniref:ABC transporter substrate-binding protein n=1 Tax=Methylopila sp. M107 TaxID=1101190 RepID=UPI0003A2001C|nr:ABC transporter substrate-binding protein [Methylopila sp. M107]